MHPHSPVRESRELYSISLKITLKITTTVRLTQHLLVNVRIQPQHRLRQACQHNRPEKRARHGSREGEVIIVNPESVRDVLCGNAIGQDVVDGLDVEGFLDLGVGSCI